MLEIGVLALFVAVVLHHGVAVAVRGEQPSLAEAALLFTAFGLAHAVHQLGWQRALAFFGICAVLSWLAEEHSIYTANVGAYYYTDVLGPKLDQVPYVIPLTWFLMMYPSHVLANLAVARKGALERSPLGQSIWLAALTAIVMTAWDLALDPYMTGKVGAWVWEEKGPYFGVPFANYYGWITVVFAIDLIYRLIEQRLPLRPSGGRGRWLAALPVGIYALNGLSSVLIGFPVETRLIAAFTMGVPVLVALIRLLSGEASPDAGGAAARSAGTAA